MYVHQYLALNEFVLDFCHAPLRPRKLKYKISKSRYKSTFDASALILSVYNTDYGPYLSCKFHLNLIENLSAFSTTPGYSTVGLSRLNDIFLFEYFD